MASTLKKTPLVWMAVWLLAMAVGAVALMASAQTARAASVTPTQVSGNPTCKTLLSPGPSYEIKVDPPKSGTYGPLTVTFSPDGKLVDFTSTVKVLGVFVKGGTDGGNFYDYRPLGGTLSDTGLKLPTNQQISHVSFCWDEKPQPPQDALEVSKTANATYDRTVKWNLEKTVDDNSHSGQAGDSFNSNWTVKATKDESLGNFEVTGDITIKNPNGVPVGYSVTDKLDDGTMADVDCDEGTAGNQASGTLQPNQTLICTYVAKPTSKSATSNNVQVSSTTSGIPGNSALAPVNWKETVKGDETVKLSDPRFPNNTDLNKDISSSTGPITQPETFECSKDPSKYTDGKYSYTETNTATLKGETTDLSAKADVKVDCALAALTASKTADGSYDRNIDWNLKKSVDPSSHSGQAGALFSSTWTVEATRSVVEDNYKVTGVITINNPSAVDQKFTVTDELDKPAGTMAIVDCNDDFEGPQPSATVPAGGKYECTYSASTATATLNTATVKADGNGDVEATAPVSYKANVIGDETVTVNDERFDYREQTSEDTFQTFGEKFDCSSDPSKYTDGKYSYKVTNTATLKGETTNESASADVNVNCSLAALTASKTADGTYNRDIKWDLTKTVDDNSHSGNAGQTAGSSNWSVKADKTAIDSNFKVEGEIKVTNTAAISQTFTVSDQLNDGTLADVTCPTLTVPADSSVTCTYTALPTGKSATKNAVTVTAPGNADAIADAPVAFTAKVTGDETVRLADQRFSYSQDISASTTKDFPEAFKCPSDPAKYTDGKYSYSVKNTATLTGQSTDLTADADVNVDCTLAALTASKTANGSYDRTIKWDLSKTVTPQSTFSGKAGDSFNYTWNVGATKSVVENNYKVTGKITINNPSAVSQTFSVTDELDKPAGTMANVDCNSDLAGDQPSATVPANTTYVCTYNAATGTATLNTATVKAAGNGDVKATAPVSYKANVIGDEQVTLGDQLLGYSKLISGNTSETFPRTFTCPTDPTKYTNYTYTTSINNVATLKGLNTNLSKAATVKFTCTYPWRAETATGAGIRYPGTSNWFMYTPYQTTKVDLIAGQNYDAGDMYMTRSGGSTYIKVTLASGFRFANVAQNLKIQDFASAPKSYVQPGQFKYKFSVAQGTNTYTAKIPGNTAKFYGIHADVERYVP